MRCEQTAAEHLFTLFATPGLIFTCTMTASTRELSLIPLPYPFLFVVKAHLLKLALS